MAFPETVERVRHMIIKKTPAMQIKELLSGLSGHGSQHLTEVETDLIQTNILLAEAIGKLGASFMAIHEVVTAQQQMVQAIVAKQGASAETVAALQLQSAQIDMHVNAAVTGLQFQDMTNQLIGRIVRRVSGFRDVLTTVGAGSDGLPVELDEAELVALLEKIAETMRTQSSMLENELWKAVCQTHMESGDVELF
jgi:hypothetical protein